MKKRVLHLNLKAVYFDAILSGEKTEEYRQANNFWQMKLQGREYDEMHIKRGYPKKTDTDKIIVLPYRGWEMKTIVHPHFNNKKTVVYAIQLV